MENTRSYVLDSKENLGCRRRMYYDYTSNDLVSFFNTKHGGVGAFLHQIRRSGPPQRDQKRLRGTWLFAASRIRGGIFGQAKSGPSTTVKLGSAISRESTFSISLRFCFRRLSLHQNTNEGFGTRGSVLMSQYMFFYMYYGL